MTELMQKAIAKIDAEAEKGGHTQKRIAQYIIDKLITDDINAKKIVADDKSLSACAEEVRKKAMKFAEKNSAMIENDEVYEWVRDYYGVREAAKKSNIIDIDLAEML